MRSVLWCVFLFSPCSLFAQPAITFESQAAVVSGLTPNAPVAWFSVSREITEDFGTIVRRDALATTDTQGGSRFALDTDVAFKSIWVVVDLTRGTSVVASPAGFTPQQAPLTSSALTQSVPGIEDGILEEKAAAEILVVRPGVGAWGLSVARGGAGDDSAGKGGTLHTSVSSLAVIGASPAAPTAFAPSDIAVVIDPDLLTINLSRIAEVQP